MSGRSAGHCTGNATPGFNNPSVVAGYRCGRGQDKRCGMGLWDGYGYRNRFFAGWSGVTRPPNFTFAPPTREREMAILKEQARYFDEQLTGIRKRLEDIEGSGTGV